MTASRAARRTQPSQAAARRKKTRAKRVSTSPPSGTKGARGAPIRSKGSTDESQGSRPFPVVGVGASAGGLEAFNQLLAHLPADTGMAFVLVQHLDPKHESRLTELLARATRDAGRGSDAGHARCAPNQVYVIPPNANIAISDGRPARDPAPRRRTGRTCRSITCSARSPRTSRRARSASCSRVPAPTARSGCARSRRSAGSPSPRTRRSAMHPGMPHSAIDSGCVDFVLAARGDRALGSRRSAAIPTWPQTTARRRPRTTDEEQLFAADPRRGAHRDAASISACTATRRSSGGSCAAWRCTRTRSLARLRAAARERPQRSRRAVPRPADQRHQLLPRPRAVRRAQGAGLSRDRQGKTADRRRCGSGCPAARPVRRRIRSRSRCSSSSTTSRCARRSRSSPPT